MHNIGLSKGIGWAAYLLAIQLVIIIPPYIYACWEAFGLSACPVDKGIEWISGHPLFPSSIIYSTAIGFLIGAFGHHIVRFPMMDKLIERYTGITAWIIGVLLVAVFVLWGLPALNELDAS